MFEKYLTCRMLGVGVLCAIILSAGASDTYAQVDMRALLDATTGAERAKTSDQTLLDPGLLNREDPMWPVYTFLLGEARRLRGENKSAARHYRELAEWAAADPYQDTWGGSGLAAVALWRWAELLRQEAAPDAESVTALFALNEQLQPMRCTRSMFLLPASIIAALPQLEEDIARTTALLARTAGKTAQAQQLFLTYLSLARTATLTEQETALSEQLVRNGMASPDRLNLLRGKRLLALKLHTEAEGFLRQAEQSEDLQIQAEARLSLAKLRRNLGAPREEIAALLDAVLEDAEKPEVIQAALLERGIIWNREGKGRDPQKFLDDMLRLIEEFPDSLLADDALYQIARYFEYADDVPNALDYYRRLREFTGENDWSSSAVFRPAMLLYGRGQTGDREQASALLQELADRPEDEIFRLLALFWLGRIHEESGDAAAAGRYFQQIIDEAPYDYYAIRARMHLERGNAAKTQLWPSAEIQAAFAEEHRRSSLPDDIASDSPYHARLRDALNTGLYAAACAADRQLRERFPSERQETLSLHDLDRQGLLTHLTLLLALRQDAFAARDRDKNSANLLRLAYAVGHIGGDWPMAMELVFSGGQTPNAAGQLRREPQYLRVAYPALFRDQIHSASQEFQVMPELLYGIMRRESLFSSSALSPRGALGLFQFVPRTFERLNQRWELVAQSRAASKEAFLMNPDTSIRLGARWCRDELLKRYTTKKYGEAALLFALMDHNAGYPVVKEWFARWTNEGRANDIEYMLDTARFGETRMFARHVLTDMILVKAAGIFHE